MILRNEERPNGHIYSESAPQASFYRETLRRWLLQTDAGTDSVPNAYESGSTDRDGDDIRQEPQTIDLVPENANVTRADSTETLHLNGVHEFEGSDELALPTNLPNHQDVLQSMETIELETNIDGVPERYYHPNALAVDSGTDSDGTFLSARSEISFSGFSFVDSDDEDGNAAGQQLTPNPKRRLSFESVQESESGADDVTPPRKSISSTPSTSGTYPGSSQRP